MTEETESKKRPGRPRGSARAAKPAPEATAPQSAPASAGQPQNPPTPAPGGVPADVLAGVMGAAGSTVRIVQKAVSVLEEELASGISTTRKLEEKMVDVEKLRSADPQEVVQRFRRDAHDVVDILIDLVNVATNSLDQLTQRVIRVRVSPSRPSQSPASGGGGIPSLAVATPVKPGGAVEIPMTLENESNRPTDVFYLLSSDLINSDGEHIPARQISFSPEKLVIDPQKSAVVTVTVHVPDDTAPGTYSGLLQATKLEQLRAVLSIQIG